MMSRKGLWVAALMALAFTLAGPVNASRAEDQAKDEAEAMAAAMEPESGGLDGIVERRMLRMAIPFNPIYFSYDGEKMIGFAVERAREFEAFLRESQGIVIDVILLPLPRDQILPAVVEGRADIAAANLTITEKRAEIIDFSDPLLTDVSELVVTGPAAGPVSSFDDLAEVGVYLRPSSSYYGHLQALNAEREAAGKAPIPVTEVNEQLEDYDLLDLVDTGLVPAIVVDDHKLALWVEVFEDIVVHRDLALNRGGEIAWALRKESPRLMEVVNTFVAEIKEGTLIGNVLAERYLGSAEWIEEIREGEALQTYNEIAPLLKRYAEEYGFDWKLILAQAYRESRLRQNKKSEAGAVGVMQVRPSTAADPKVDIENIHDVENNIHAGIKYLRFLRDHYFDSRELSQLDEVLFSLAAYNAGPRNIARARKRAEKMGLDPNVWFSNVEIAAARTISREPVAYVRNIYKYFVSLSLVELRAKDSAVAATLDQREGPGETGGMGWTIAVFAGLLLLLGGVAFFWHRAGKPGSWADFQAQRRKP